MDFIPYLHIDRVYHGTYHVFDRFEPLSHFGTLAAAKDRLLSQHPAHDPDSTFNIQNPTAEHLNHQIHNLYLQDNSTPIAEIRKKYQSRIISAHLNLLNPLWITDADHSLNNYKGYVLNYLVDNCPEVKNIIRHIFQKYYDEDDYDILIAQNIKKTFKDLTETPIASYFHFIFTDPITRPLDEVKKELALETLFSAEQTQTLSEEINRSRLIKQRLIRFFESQGFDGFAYVNQYEDVGSTSYIIFRPEQVISDQQEQLEPTQKISETNNRKLADICQDYVAKTNSIPLKADDLDPFIEYLLLDNQAILATSTWVHFALTQVLPEIMPLHLNTPSPTSDLTDIERRILLGIDIALVMEANPLLVILACALYDEKSTHNKHIQNKNIQSVTNFLSQHDFHLSQKEKEEVVQAIIDCTQRTPQQNLVSACLWDAQQLDKKLTGKEKNPYFATPYGHMLNQDPIADQKKYFRCQKKIVKALYICSYVLGDQPHLLNPQHGNHLSTHHKQISEHTI